MASRHVLSYVQDDRMVHIARLSTTIYLLVQQSMNLWEHVACVFFPTNKNVTTIVLMLLKHLHHFGVEYATNTGYECSWIDLNFTK